MHWLERMLRIALEGKCWRCNGTGRMFWREWNWKEDKEFQCGVCGGTGIKTETAQRRWTPPSNDDIPF